MFLRSLTTESYNIKALLIIKRAPFCDLSSGSKATNAGIFLI
jgi:hypothetical protein